jgi:uncharacterized protein (TIGR01777 family)
LTNSVLVTGASGLIGRRLTEILLQKGCRVSHLGRVQRTGTVSSYRWDPETGYIDKEAIRGMDTIVHLAGAGIGDKRWSASRKKEILESRVKSSALLRDILATQSHGVKTVISISAIGYYGRGDETRTFTEEDSPGDDFLSSVVVDWERETQRLATDGLRLVTLRTGVVFSDRGGALPEIMRPIRFGVGAPLGTGKQWLSWIHIDDLCEMFAWAIERPVSGVFNAVSPHPVSNAELTHALGRRMRRPLLLPPIPAWLLRLVLGEMADLVLYGSRVSCDRVVRSGFAFRFPECEKALDDLIAS